MLVWDYINDKTLVCRPQFVPGDQITSNESLLVDLDSEAG